MRNLFLLIPLLSLIACQGDDITNAAEIANERAGPVLEIGVGTGLTLRRYRKDHKVVGIDISPDLIAAARENCDRALPRLRCTNIELVAQDVLEYEVTIDDEGLSNGDVLTNEATHVTDNPSQYVPGSLGREMTLTIGWGAVSRIDLLPGQCSDPECDGGDHGYEGTVAADDIGLRISAEAEGRTALDQAIEFARDLSSSIGH